MYVCDTDRMLLIQHVTPIFVLMKLVSQKYNNTGINKSITPTHMSLFA